jgi:archaellum component FlaC
MTTAEAPAHKPTAKQLADQALEELAQLRTELTEVRDSVREGGTVAVTATGMAKAADLDDLEDRTAKGFERLQQSLDKLKLSGGGDATEAVEALKQEMVSHFASFSKIVDGHNTAATGAIKELREQMPTVADLVKTVQELDEKVRLFDEAGVAPASSEDLSNVHSQVNEAHQRITALTTAVEKLAGYLESPTFAAVEKAADTKTTIFYDPNTVLPMPSSAPAIYGQVHELMKLVTELGKDKKADAKMGGYAFRSIDSAMDAVGSALRTVGVMFQPREITDKRVERYETVSKDGYRQNWTHVWVTQKYVFVSLRDGSEMPAVEMDGEARDNGDKSTSKADSMRFKYALLQALCIPVNGLPESDGRDGTEGGQVYGRGDAGEAFDNATPARPQEGAPQQATAYGHGHQPPESPGGQAHAQAAQETQPDDRTPEEKATAAYHALVALAGLEKPAQRPQLNRILNGISSQRLESLPIMTADGRTMPLGEYASVVNSQVGA